MGYVIPVNFHQWHRLKSVCRKPEKEDGMGVCSDLRVPKEITEVVCWEIALIASWLKDTPIPYRSNDELLRMFCTQTCRSLAPSRQLFQKPIYLSQAVAVCAVALLADSPKMSFCLQIPKLWVSWTPLEYEMEAEKRPLRDDRGSRQVRLAPAGRQKNIVLTLKATDLHLSACPWLGFEGWIAKCGAEMCSDGVVCLGTITWGITGQQSLGEVCPGLRGDQLWNPK